MSVSKKDVVEMIQDAYNKLPDVREMDTEQWLGDYISNLDLSKHNDDTLADVVVLAGQVLNLMFHAHHMNMLKEQTVGMMKVERGSELFKQIEAVMEEEMKNRKKAGMDEFMNEHWEKGIKKPH